jgi:hypothetical protein
MTYKGGSECSVDERNNFEKKTEGYIISSSIFLDVFVLNFHFSVRQILVVNNLWENREIVNKIEYNNVIVWNARSIKNEFSKDPLS